MHDRRQGYRIVIVQHGMVDGESWRDRVQETYAEKRKCLQSFRRAGLSMDRSGDGVAGVIENRCTRRSYPDG